MSSIDNRIVKMGFDNAQFIQKASATISCLSKLDSSLKLTEGVKGLNGVSKAIKDVDMTTMSSAVDTVSNRFSVMEIVGVTALVNLANSAVNAGKNFVKSLTIDPVLDGLNEYETKMNAIQTIQTNTASKGTTLDQINSALAELNEYSDQTIYNFAQMTDNIGKMTAAGLSLEDGVSVVKGMSNVAAGFGVDATRMAGATYQMSQALAAGTVRLQDWKSMEQSGMGGTMLQDQLYATADEMGVFIDKSVPFNATLEQNWLSAEVFTKTMDKMAKDPALISAATNVTTFTKLVGVMKESVGSGWAVSWENIFGSKEQSTELFTSISNNFNTLANSMAGYRNEALETWNKTGGREAVLEGLKNILVSIGKVLGPIYESFKKIIDPWNGERLISLSKSFADMTSKIKISDDTMSLLSRTFDGVFSIFSIVGSVIGSVASALGSLLPLTAPIIDGILSITAPLGDLIVKLKDFIQSSGVFSGVFTVISGVVSKVSGILGDALGKLGDWVGKIGDIDMSGLSAFSSKILECFTPIEWMGNLVNKIIDTIKKSLETFIPIAMNFATKVWEVLTKISQAIFDTLGGKGTALTNIMNTGLIAAIVLGVKKVISVFKNIGESVGGVIDSVVEIFDGVKDSLEAFQNSLKADTLIKIASAVGILAVSLLVIATIDSAKLIGALASMGVMFGQLVGAMAVLDKIGGGAKVGLSVVILATSILVLSKALSVVATIPWQDSLKGLGSLAVMMTMMIIASKTMEKNSKGMLKSSIAMTIFASAIIVLGKSVKSIGELDTDVITKGLIGVGVMMTQIALFMKATNLSGMSVMKAAGILILSQALVILSKAVKQMGDIDKNGLIKGLGSIAIILTEIALFMKLIGNPKGIVSTAIGLTILGGALVIMGNAIQKMGELPVEVLKNGLTSMAFALTILAVAMKIMPKNITTQAIALTILGGALVILSKAVQSFGNIPIDSLTQGLVALGASLTILAIALRLMKGAISGAVAMTIMAVALALLVPSMVILGSLSIETIGKSLIALAGAFTVIGIAGLLLGPLALPIIALAGAISIMGAACLAVGVGIAAFSAGLTALAISGTAGAAALVVIITSIVGLIPMIATSLATGLLNVLQVFINGATVITTAIATLITAIADAIILSAPKILAAVVSILKAMLKALQDTIPVLLETIKVIILSVLETLANMLPEIASMLVTFIATLTTTVLTDLANSIGPIASAIVDIIVAIITSIGDGVPRVVSAVFDMVIAMINGLADSIETRMPEVRAAVKRLTTAIIDEFKACIVDAVSVGGDIIGGIVSGISDGIGKVVEAAKGVAKSALDGAKNLLGIHSPSREFMKIGMFTSEGMANGISNGAGLVSDQATALGEGALDGVKSAMSALNDGMLNDVDGNPTITPVLDLSNVQNGARQLDNMWNKEQSINATMKAARRISSDMSDKAVVAGEQTNNTTQQTDNSNTYNTFNVTGDNPKQIANEVSRILQKQVERRSTVWA